MSGSSGAHTRLELLLLAPPEFFLQNIHLLSESEEIVISWKTNFLASPRGDILG